MELDPHTRCGFRSRRSLIMRIQIRNTGYRRYYFCRWSCFLLSVIMIFCHFEGKMLRVSQQGLLSMVGCSILMLKYNLKLWLLTLCLLLVVCASKFSQNNRLQLQGMAKYNSGKLPCNIILTIFLGGPTAGAHLHSVCDPGSILFSSVR